MYILKDCHIAGVGDKDKTKQKPQQIKQKTNSTKIICASMVSFAGETSRTVDSTGFSSNFSQH